MNIYQHQCVFADNLATQHYYSIIENAIQQPRKKYRKTNPLYQYYEEHHVLPKSIFPEYKKSLWNKVLLTAEEHYNCHKLLLEMTDGKNRSKMVCALWYMTSARTLDMHRKIQSGEEFEQAKINWSEYMSELKLGKKCSQETKDKISASNKGRKPSAAAIEAVIKYNTGRKRCPISVEKSRLAQLGNTNVKGRKCWTNGIEDTFSNDCPGEGWHIGKTYKHSELTKRKIGEAGKGRVISDETRKKMSEKSKGIKKADDFGAKISIAKKGKKTNQQEIMGRKYASMNDEEFNSYISKMKSLLAKNRATNLRTKWINIVEDLNRDSNESK
jgi:hypothetical protein